MHSWVHSVMFTEHYVSGSLLGPGEKGIRKLYPRPGHPAVWSPPPSPGHLQFSWDKGQKWSPTGNYRQVLSMCQLSFSRFFFKTKPQKNQASRSISRQLAFFSSTVCQLREPSTYCKGSVPSSPEKVVNRYFHFFACDSYRVNSKTGKTFSIFLRREGKWAFGES